jgi:hypothetical protein
MSAALDTLGSTQGSVLVRGGSAWSPAIGSSGDLLQSLGTSSPPAWASVPGMVRVAKTGLSTTSNHLTDLMEFDLTGFGGSGFWVRLTLVAKDSGTNVDADSADCAFCVKNLAGTISATTGTETNLRRDGNVVSISTLTANIIMTSSGTNLVRLRIQPTWTGSLNSLEVHYTVYWDTQFIPSTSL